MSTSTRRWLFGAVSLALLGTAPARAADAPGTHDAAAVNKMLGRGINFGNGLDAPSEGEWGFSLKAEYFPAIKKAGFDSVRIPVRWAPHAGPAPDHKIDPTYMARVEWAVDQALNQGLAVVLNIHHDEAAAAEPEKYIPRAATFWRQIAARFEGRDERLVFELLNEPNGAMTDDKWQASFPKLLAAIRQSNPKRVVMVGPGHWNSMDSLPGFTPPADDQNLIITFHYYSPFEFTHQDADWMPEAKAWHGRTWTGTPEQVAALRKDLTRAADWGKQHRRPLYLGEFGAYSKADMPSRQAWTVAVARECEARGISWCYWEFGSGFGAYDPGTDQWRRPILNALIPPQAGEKAGATGQPKHDLDPS